MTPESHIEHLTEKIGDLYKSLNSSIEMPQQTLEKIRQRDRDIDYLGSGWRRLETCENGDIEVVSVHHNAGRQVIATIPGWAEGMAEHVMHAQDDIERLLAENARLRSLVDLKNATALRAGLTKGRA